MRIKKIALNLSHAFLLRTVALMVVTLPFLLLSQSVMAKTVAGTAIKNQASLSYSLVGGGGAVNALSNESVFLVQEVLDVAAIWKDSAAIQTASPDSQKILSFLVTNTGNGTQRYTLTFDTNIPGDDFNPVGNTSANGSIYLESGGLPGFQINGANSDTSYKTLNYLELKPGQSQTVYLIMDIPTNLIPTNKGLVDLKLISNTPGLSVATVVGTVLPGAGTGGVDVVVGPSTGKAQARGVLEVNQVIVNNSKKIISILDTKGGNQLLPQSVLTYEILIDIKGTGRALDLMIEDLLPPQTDYITGSTVLNEASKTEASDSDELTYANRTLYFNLGSPVSGNSFKIRYQVKVQ